MLSRPCLPLLTPFSLLIRFPPFNPRPPKKLIGPEAEASHGVRGGALPEYWRVLERRHRMVMVASVSSSEQRPEVKVERKVSKAPWLI